MTKLTIDGVPRDTALALLELIAENPGPLALAQLVKQLRALLDEPATVEIGGYIEECAKAWGGTLSNFYTDWSRKIKNPNYIGEPVPFQIRNDDTGHVRFYENWYDYDPHYLNTLHGYGVMTSYTVIVPEGHGVVIGDSEKHQGSVAWKLIRTT